jgi:lipopolysaccharide/colanic/teichoic acid biosynthesis glycosyltransferase
MSIVGPRPLVAAELALLSDGGAERSAIRPGITGWAQVHGGQLLDLPAKAALDLWYARHTSLALDLRILLLTVRMVVRGERLDAPVLDRVEAAHAEARQGRGVAWASAR